MQILLLLKLTGKFTSVRTPPQAIAKLHFHFFTIKAVCIFTAVTMANRILIKGGQVVNETGSEVADVYIEDR